MIREQPLRPICAGCRRLPARSNGRSKLGFQLWHKLCNACARQQYQNNNQKEMTCGECGFTGVDRCQLSYVDDHTLCQNCNALRLKRLRRRKELTVDATLDWANITI